MENAHCVSSFAFRVLRPELFVIGAESESVSTQFE